jgi:ketosteroid isomerase-like protein
MRAQQHGHPAAVIERLCEAQNRHDLEAFVGCFAADYRSEQPTHPARFFIGQDQVRQNWAEVFTGIPNFRAELLTSAVAGDVMWNEWRWTGTNIDGTPFHWRGVTVFGVRQDRIDWGRLYMEPVEEGGADIDETVRRMAGGI